MQDLSFLKGSEAWVGEFLKMLPADRSILYNYVANAAQATHANAGLHVGMGLILLTQIGPRYGLRTLAARAPMLVDEEDVPLIPESPDPLDGLGEPFSNLFVLCLAPSGHAKTASLTIGMKVAAAAGLNTLVVDPPGSREGFIDSLDDMNPESIGKPRQALVYPEFADFLGITASARKGHSGGHAATMRSNIMSAYDGYSTSRVLASSRNRESGQLEETHRGTRHPVLSMIGAGNYRVLSRHTIEDDWHDGFMGRFCIFDGEMERFYPMQPQWPDAMKQVVKVLRRRAAAESIRRAQWSPIFPLPATDSPYGHYYPDAFDLMAQWSTRNHEIGRGETNGLVAAALPRLQPLCARLAALLCLDFGEAGHFSWQVGPDGTMQYNGFPQPGWRISRREVEAAIFLAERHLAAYRYASTHVVLNEEERPIRDVECALRRADAGNRLLTEGQISADTARTTRTVSDALITLMSRGVVRKVQPAEGTSAIRYQVVDGFTDKVVSLFPSAPPALAVSAPPALALATRPTLS